MLGSNMLELFKILNKMVEDGAIKAYALCGAMAAFEYIEPAATRDVDVTAKMITSGLILDYQPIINFLNNNNIPVKWDEEGLYIAGYPVQFIPDDKPLDTEALANAAVIDNEGVTVPIWRIEYLMAKCLEVFRPKDQLRLVQFLEVGYNREEFCNLIQRFELTERWQAFCSRFDQDDFCSA